MIEDFAANMYAHSQNKSMVSEQSISGIKIILLYKMRNIDLLCPYVSH
jgi:hypothetical protein